MNRVRTPIRRAAAVTIELIVALPVFLVFLAGTIEFGLIQANSQQVALASRVGAKLAAESSLSPLATIASDVRTAVDRQLESAGFGPNASAGITLRHSVGVAAVATDGTCPDPTSPTMPTDAVRVTVCVPLSALTPDLLNFFGFTIAGKTVELTTTYSYEL